MGLRHLRKRLPCSTPFFRASINPPRAQPAALRWARRGLSRNRLALDRRGVAPDRRQRCAGADLRGERRWRTARLSRRDPPRRAGGRNSRCATALVGPARAVVGRRAAAFRDGSRRRDRSPESCRRGGVRRREMRGRTPAARSKEAAALRAQAAAGRTRCRPGSACVCPCCGSPASSPGWRESTSMSASPAYPATTASCRSGILTAPNPAAGNGAARDRGGDPRSPLRSPAIRRPGAFFERTRPGRRLPLELGGAHQGLIVVVEDVDLLGRENQSDAVAGANPGGPFFLGQDRLA